MENHHFFVDVDIKNNKGGTKKNQGVTLLASKSMSGEW